MRFRLQVSRHHGYLRQVVLMRLRIWRRFTESSIGHRASPCIPKSHSSNLGAFTIRIGFWGFLIITIVYPPNPNLMSQDHIHTAHHSVVGFRGLGLGLAGASHQKGETQTHGTASAPRCLEVETRGGDTSRTSYSYGLLACTRSLHVVCEPNGVALQVLRDPLRIRVLWYPCCRPVQTRKLGFEKYGVSENRGTLI